MSTHTRFASSRRRSPSLPASLVVFLLVLLLQGPAVPASSPLAAPERPAGNEASGGVRKLLDQGKYADAETEARGLLARVQAAGRHDSIEAALLLDLLVEALTAQGKVRDPETRSLADRALKIKEGLLGPGSLEASTTLTLLGMLSSRAGDFAAARSFAERSLAIREKALSPDHPDLAGTLNALGISLRELGEYDKAQAALERALAIQEKALDPEDPALARTLSNLGNVFANQGRYADAEPFMRRSLAIREKKFGPDHASLGIPLNNLGTLLMMAGDYAGARPLLERALAIREKTLGVEAPDVGLTLGNLATLWANQADYARSEEYARRSIQVLEKGLGPEHTEVMAAVFNLAATLIEVGRPAEALPLLNRALDVQEKRLGPDHPDIASALGLLANANRDLGNIEEARPLYQRTMAIRERIFPSNHPDRALGLKDFGEYLLARGEYDRALGSLQQALAIYQNVLGPDVPEVADALLWQASAHWGLGDAGRALEDSLRGERSLRVHLLKTAPALSERQALRYESRLSAGIGLAVSVLSAPDGPAGGARRLQAAWDEIIRSRAFVLDEMARRHRTVLDSESAEVARIADRLADARSRLAHLALVGLDKDFPDRFRTDLAGRQAEVERIEQELSARSRLYRFEGSAGRAGYAEVAGALPARAALVAYLEFDRTAGPARAPSRPPAGNGAPVRWFAALTLDARSREPRLTLLGPASDIDSLVQDWRAQVDATGRGAEAAGSYRAAGEKLRKAIWDPLHESVKGSRMALIVPDGSLNLINLGTLPVGGDRFLVESGPLLHLLSAERDLVREARSDRARGRSLVLGGPDFDRPPPVLAARPLRGGNLPPRPGGGSAGAAVFRSATASCEDFLALRFVPLPGARDEAEEVSVQLEKGASSAGRPPGVLKLTGPSASEEAFKALAPGMDVLHLATHGFFLGDRCGTPDATNPLVLSGLALSGANLRASSPATAGAEDGILTAAEIASLDLRDASWVVLSACDTGVGMIQSGEGVLGLRRSFQVAGAGTLIMSLWPVADVPTREWVRALYSSRLSGAPAAEVVRDATLKMIAARRKAGVYPYPSSWGAFVATGDWR